MENKISNEVQKTLIRNNFPPHIADKMCKAIDSKEKADHFIRLLREWYEEIVRQQMQQQYIQMFLQQYNTSRK